MDKIVIGRDVLPSGAAPVLGTKTVMDRLMPRQVLAHEYGHLFTGRRGTAFALDLALDEFQASIVGRQLSNLSLTERYQLMRDAVERARNLGGSPRELPEEMK